MIGPLTKSVQDLAQAIREFAYQGSPAWQQSQRIIQEQLKAILHGMEEMEKKIMATQKEITEKLKAAAATSDKSHAETVTLLEKLKEAVENQEGASPELVAATDALVAKIEAQDALVEDEGQPVVPDPPENLEAQRR